MGILGNIFRKKITDTVAPEVTKAPAMPALPAPLGLTPGSVWTPAEVDLSLAQADGSIITVPQGDQIVEQVGISWLFGMDVYNAYFKDVDCFLQAVTLGGKVDQIKQLRLFTLYKTVLTPTVQDVEFWLGRLDRDHAGNVVRDKWGKSQVVDAGLIGWPQFQIDGPPALLYDRQWATQNDAPVRFKEQIRSNSNKEIVAHEAMEYARPLTSDTNTTMEYLFVTFLGATGTVKVYVGVDLDLTTQNIISVA